jgi:FdhD protein
MSAAHPARTFRTQRFGAEGPRPDRRMLPDETPVAVVHDATTTAVMMATPADLEDFAVGFSFTEGVAGPEDISEIEIAPVEHGVEARIWLKSGAGASLRERRRTMAGPTGCGLCGLDSLRAAQRVLPVLPRTVSLAAEDVGRAMASLSDAQPLGRATRAVHAAGYWTPGAGLQQTREDVGRHNALDKLVGALLRSGAPREGLIVLTSRISIELVQMAVLYGVEVLAAVSAPTALAVEAADAAGLTLIGVARADGFEVFTHPGRIA